MGLWDVEDSTSSRQSAYRRLLSGLRTDRASPPEIKMEGISWLGHERGLEETTWEE
jgi:hypothetical protein